MPQVPPRCSGGDFSGWTGIIFYYPLVEAHINAAKPLPASMPVRAKAMSRDRMASPIPLSAAWFMPRRNESAITVPISAKAVRLTRCYNTIVGWFLSLGEMLAQSAQVGFAAAVAATFIESSRFQALQAWFVFVHGTAPRGFTPIIHRLHPISQPGANPAKQRKKRVTFKSLADPWCDTSTMHGELLVTLLAGFATFERRLIVARTTDGRTRAKARGVRFGRPRKLTAHQRQEALARLANGETQADIARSFAVDPTTIGRLAHAPAQ